MWLLKSAQFEKVNRLMSRQGNNSGSKVTDIITTSNKKHLGKIVNTVHLSIFAQVSGKTGTMIRQPLYL